MPTIKSLQEDIDLLRKENSDIKKRLSEIEKKQFSVSGPEKKPNSALGIILIILGGLLCLTFIGAIIGLPLLIWGIVIVSRQPSSDNAAAPETKTEKNTAAKKVPAIENTVPEKITHKGTESFEENLGMKWFARIGILALVIGIGFFIKYAIDNNLINHLTRIIIGAASGIFLIIFGEIASKKEKYSSWGKTLIGGGFAITYFSIYAAYIFEEYRAALGISPVLEIILLSIVVIMAIVMSLRDNSQIIAAESFFLGYMTALLSNNFETMTLVYGVLLTIGLVIIVSYKKWPVIGIGGVIASYLMYLLWRGKNPDSFLYASFILLFYFISFSLQVLFLRKNKEFTWHNVAVTLINSGFFYLAYYFQIKSNYSDFAGLFTLLLALFYFISYRMSGKDSLKLADTNLYLSLLFITAAVPVQLNSKYVTIIWALEALLLVALYLKTKIDVLKMGSYALSAATAAKTLIYDTLVLEKLDFHNLAGSTRSFSFLATILCFYIIYYLWKKNHESVQESEKWISPLHSWFASFFLVMVLFLELDSYTFWITVSLLLISLSYMVISSSNSKEIAYQSAAISIIAFLKLILHDSSALEKFSSSSFFSSERLFAFFIASIAFYILAYFTEKKKDIFYNSLSFLKDAYLYAGTFLSFMIIALEVKDFWTSVWWSVLALALIVAGMSLNKKHFRIQGMMIFSFTILKVFIYDTRSLSTIYRTISYIVLGVILLLVSFIYTKNKEKMKSLL